MEERQRALEILRARKSLRRGYADVQSTKPAPSQTTLPKTKKQCSPVEEVSEAEASEAFVVGFENGDADDQDLGSGVLVRTWA